MTTCEACRVAEATERVDDAPEVIYSVCIPCAHRLQQRSLRPREWLHLASLHGAQAFLLHDDFYDDDGTAAQPEGPVEDAASDPFPDRLAWERDPRLAFHVALVKWALPEEIVAVLRLDRASTLSLLWAISTRAHGAAACELAARVLGADAADWARERGAANDVSFWSLGRVCAACLPREEGLRVMSDAIERAPPEHRPDALLGLSSFHDPAVLALVERWARSPVVETYGNVAAANALSWSVAERWLSSGRPTSLVALDALTALADPRTPFLRDLRPRLVAPPSIDVFTATLREVAARDDSPRVTRAVAWLLARAAALGVIGAEKP